jgi:hypothetical protein
MSKASSASCLIRIRYIMEYIYPSFYQRLTEISFEIG